MKKKCLLIFKWPVSLQKFVINKISKFYDTEYLYISDFKNESSSEIISEINRQIKLKNIEIVFFDVDFIKFLNFFFINKIKNVKKILMTFDDFAIHEMNSITANACDLVLSHCPFSVLKYKEKGYKAFCMPCESDDKVFKNYNLKKEIEVLFFGQVTPDRKEFLDFISSSGISIKRVGINNEYVSEEELSKLISKSKIVLNLSKSVGTSVINYVYEDIYKFNYQWKGRVIISGLCGTLCVSEYSPAHEIMFNEEESPFFYTKEECVIILKKLLNDQELLSKHTNKFCSKVYNLWEDKKNFEPIYKTIESSSFRKVELIKIPYWYLRIAAKQFLLRNIKISRIVKTIFEFKEIFQIIKNSNIIIKFLVIAESVVNIIWYSFLSALKFKK